MSSDFSALQRGAARYAASHARAAKMSNAGCECEARQRRRPRANARRPLVQSGEAEGLVGPSRSDRLRPCDGRVPAEVRLAPRFAFRWRTTILNIAPPNMMTSTLTAVGPNYRHGAI